ncbi:hypothetical protein QJS10_CPA10g00034 [Acorus calamus]|uniref:DC1 domain-containing protein n=1 Tax=Acorus calamus TaxID=4465 RepID=A0AAV9DZI9_ACOCL|nr:hypothetical protein QJS10_CPA10g00034 [Acorus calamus]
MENQRNLRNSNLTGANNQEIFHFSHPQHPLWQVDLPYLFNCTGCKEYGAGRRFRCRTCDFDLHEFCALASPSLHGHPSHEQHQLVFFIKPGDSLHWWIGAIEMRYLQQIHEGLRILLHTLQLRNAPMLREA